MRGGVGVREGGPREGRVSGGRGVGVSGDTPWPRIWGDW